MSLLRHSKKNFLGCQGVRKKNFEESTIINIVEKYTDKKCKKHGICRYVLEGRGYYRCTKCRMDAVARKRRRIKLDLVEYKGGKCEICGYNKCIAALEFHHRDHKQKDFSLSGGETYGLNRSKKEVDKCILVCSNCHKEIHHKEGYLHLKAENKISA